MNEIDKIKEIEKNGKKYTIQYLKEEMLEKNIPKKKIIILGLSGTSKSSFLFYFMKDEFKQCSPTISLDISNYKFKVNDEIIQIQIWDTCGNDEFARLTPNLFKNVFIAIILYEVESRESFNDIDKWYNILRHYGSAFIYLIGLISNEKKRQVSTLEGENLKKDYYFKFFMEVCLKSGFNKEIILDEIAIDAYEDYQDYQNKEEEENNYGKISLEGEDFCFREEKIQKKKNFFTLFNKKYFKNNQNKEENNYGKTALEKKDLMENKTQPKNKFCKLFNNNKYFKY